MMLEMNDVLIDGAGKTVSMMAHERRMTCLTGGSPQLRSQFLLALLDLVPLKSGVISIDGEPLEAATQAQFRGMMAYVPARLDAVGQVKVYEAPSVQDVFGLKDNREAAISNGLLVEEMKRTGAPSHKAQLLAVAVLRQRPILLVDSPAVESLDYLKRLAANGRIVIVSSDDEHYKNEADQLVEL